LEGSGERVLDILEILDTLGIIDKDIGGRHSEVPDSGGMVLIPSPVTDKGFDLGLLVQRTVGTDFTGLEGKSKFIIDWLGNTPESVLLVGGLGEASLAGLSSDGLTVGDNWVGLDNLDILGVEFSEILETDFDVEITTTRNNVLFGTLVLLDDNKRIRLGEFLETIHELWEVLRVLGVNGDSDNWGDGVLHHSDVVGFHFVFIDNSCLLLDAVINTNEGTGVTAWNVIDGFLFSTHHEDGSLDTFFIGIELVSGFVLTSLDLDFHTSGDGSGEDSTESSESGEILGGEHLGDEHTKSTFGITGGDGLGNSIGLGTFIEVLDSVFLGSSGGWELHHDHL
jgi:hypothetical protein